MSNVKMTIIAGAHWNKTDKALKISYDTVDPDELNINIYPEALNPKEFTTVIITSEDIDDLADFLVHMRSKKVSP